jgi:hypothetical protein
LGEVHESASDFRSKPTDTVSEFEVEMGGLEPPTPYMRSDSRRKRASGKKARKDEKPRTD